MRVVRLDVAGVAVRARGVLERGEGDGQVDGAANGGPPGAVAGALVCVLPEHVFGKVGAAPDGSGGVQPFLHEPCERRAAPARQTVVPARQTVVPSEDQTSIFVRTRAMTSLVNSLVVAWPPRSGVRTPAAVASSTDS